MRQLHDTMQQQVCALKTLGYDLPGKFITWMWTLFEKQKHSQTSTDVPHYQKILVGLYWPLDLSFWDLMHNNKEGSPTQLAYQKSQYKTVVSLAMAQVLLTAIA